MSNDYGLIVNNSNGGVMFDSRKGMSSYVIRELDTGTATSTPLANGEFLFVKIPSGSASSMSSKIIVQSTRDLVGSTETDLNNPVRHFYGFTDSDPYQMERVTLDYFIVTHSSNVDTSGENYGLVVNNVDSLGNTTVQFDSRSIKFGNHFLITQYYPPKSVDSDPTDGAQALGDLTAYWNIEWTDGSAINPQMFDVFITGLRWTGSNGPIAISFWETDFDGFDGGGDEGGFGGGFGGGGNSTTTSRNYASKIQSMVLAAELV